MNQPPEQPGALAGRSTPVATALARASGAEAIAANQTIQTLWSGYGSLDRYQLQGGRCDSVIVKHVRLAKQGGHPRGWGGDRSHQRKLRSYQVETCWYERWAVRCGEDCRVPHCLAAEHVGDEVVLVLEDLDAVGFGSRRERGDARSVDSCLRWLAAFHATFMGESPQGLWPVGTYWHLDTRPDEWAAMPDSELKQLASSIDRLLSKSPYQTLVHGDAKLANFCFNGRGDAVTAVDFQYTGGGCGMKDLAYFIGSSYRDDECERLEASLLDRYFRFLRSALAHHQPGIDADAVETAWRPLFAVAWADFHRFLIGWSPGHWKIHGYSERISRSVVQTLRSSL